MSDFWSMRRLSAGALGVVLAFAANGAMAQGCPDWSGQGQQLTYSMSDLGAAQSVPVVAGGNVNLSGCNIPGGANGYVITSPDFDLSLTANDGSADLSVSVQGECDTVLLVNDATGTWHFSDDANGTLQPEVVISAAPAGAYDIWVGTFSQQTCSAQLVLSARGGSMAGGDGKPGDAPTILPDPGNMTSYRGQDGTVLYFEVTGSGSGSVWGSGLYTDDSSVARAAVHAGVLQAGQSGVVMVEVMPGQQSYPSVMANGVQSSSYGSWSGSYRFLDADGNPVDPAAAGGDSK